MYSLAKRILFTMSPEAAHNVTIEGLAAGHRLKLLPLFAPKPVSDPYSCMGIEFPNRVGLAAGMDKNGEAIDAWGALGFGSVEVGTVTPRPQPGNPKPRLFRLPEHGAIINRMGFNNAGVDALVERLAKRQFEGVVGVNIGKNFDTPVEDAAKDYLTCLDKVYCHSDYVAINLSSPNTPGLRELQFGDKLTELLAQMRERQLFLQGQHQRYVPIAVKLAPDMSQDDLAQVCEQIKASELDGIIATNTTVERDAVAGHKYADEAGGLSGAPLKTVSTRVCQDIRNIVGDDYPVIGVGGISSGLDAAERVRAGADIVQVYSGMIYRGPQLIAEAAKAIARL